MVFAALVLSAALPVQSVCCTNCNGVGSIEVQCPRCSGKGLIHPPKSFKITRGAVDRWGKMLPCPDCLKGMSRQDSKGTGKKKIPCKICKGQKKIKVKKP